VGTPGNVSPWYIEAQPRQGSNVGSRPCSSKKRHENITNPKVISPRKEKTESCKKSNSNKEKAKI
jgi:hypothetical protein